MVEYENMEKAIMCQIAGKLLEAIPEEEKKKILEKSLIKTLSDTLSSWQVESAIKKDVLKYMEKYIQDPEVQNRIKISVQRSFDQLIDGMILTIVAASQDAYKSEYRRFMEVEKKK